MADPARLNRPDIAALHNRDQFSDFDNAAQTVTIAILPSYAIAREKLGSKFGVTDAQTALRNMGEFHSQTIGQLEKRTHAAAPLTEQFHQFYSLVYHLPPENNALADTYRTAIDTAFSTLNLPSPLTEEKVKESIPAILDFTARTQQKGGR